MLVLSRQRDEVIRIGESITVQVTDIRGDKVRLGVDAPKHLSIHREEVYQAIKKEGNGNDGQGHKGVGRAQPTCSHCTRRLHLVETGDRYVCTYCGHDAIAVLEWQRQNTQSQQTSSSTPTAGTQPAQAAG